MKRLMMHVCCGPCSTHAIEKMKKGYEISLFFYNPNIYPKQEHDKRLANARIVAAKTGLPMIEGEYDAGMWEKAVEGHEDGPEGGKRCEICFKIRLEETARTAKKEGCELFTTTLTISPFKDAGKINSIGRKIGEDEGIRFLELDLKKEDGFRKSIQMSKDMGLYRQHYCGCRYSMPRP